ncbi:MAG TPA: hypothetical protein VGP97_02380 [Burkholderiales bacterium]|jgi:hypothetical protein|nr:hypothetical protein [Burkholderiales bacterium]
MADYPAELACKRRLADGRTVLIRPIRADAMAVTAVARMYQCAETTRTARDLPMEAPRARHGVIRFNAGIIAFTVRAG